MHCAQWPARAGKKLRLQQMVEKKTASPVRPRSPPVRAAPSPSSPTGAVPSHHIRPALPTPLLFRRHLWPPALTGVAAPAAARRGGVACTALAAAPRSPAWPRGARPSPPRRSAATSTSLTIRGCGAASSPSLSMAACAYILRWRRARGARAELCPRPPSLQPRARPARGLELGGPTAGGADRR